MTIGQWLITVSTLLLASHFLKCWAERLLLSTAVIAVVFGVLFSVLISLTEIDTGLRWQNLSALVLQLLLPMMVFANACRQNRHSLFASAKSSFYLCVPGLILGVLVCSVVLYALLKLVSPLAFGATLIVAFILSASDPFCLSGYFRRHKSTSDIPRTLERESVFVDTIVVLGYTLLVLVHTHMADDWQAWQLVGFFVANLLGEFVIGALLGAATWAIVRGKTSAMHRQLFAIAAALLALGLCQQLLVTDGLLAAFIIGLACGDARKDKLRAHEALVLSEVVEYLCALMILALVGLSFTVEMFTDNWPAMLCACAAVLVARAVVVGAAPKFCLEGLQRKWLFLGYSQCAIPAALVLSLTTEVQSWYLLQSMVYGVAAMTLLLRGPVLAVILARQHPVQESLPAP